MGDKFHALYAVRSGTISTRFRHRGFSARGFHLSMLRHDIGNYLGLAVETVSRLFARFQQSGLPSVQ